MFTKVSLKMKLLGSFLIILGFLILTSVISNFGMNTVQDKYHYVATSILDNIQNSYEMDKAFQEGNRNLLRIFLVDSEEDIVRNVLGFYKNFAVFKEYDDKYRTTDFVEGEKVLYDEMVTHYKEYLKQAEIFLGRVKQNPMDKAGYKELLADNVREARHKFNGSMVNLLKFHRTRAKEMSLEAEAVYHKTRNIVIVISILTIFLGVAIGWVFSSSISKKILRFSKEIESSSFSTSEASTQLAQYSSQLSQGSTESAASLEETVSSLEELTSMVKLNSDHAREANSLSQSSLVTAEQGEGHITNLIEVMSTISKSSKKIEDITNVIDDIAFQTNLLALNAAVEAARAGEHGKGFAIVADAVRGLAIRSAAAAKDINSLIEENVSMSGSGEKVAKDSGNALKEILISVKKVADLNGEISAASVEQSNGIDQISRAMNHLDQAIQGNASSAEQVDSSASNMRTQAESLQDLVEQLQKFVHGDSSSGAGELVQIENYHQKKETHNKKREA